MTEMSAGGTYDFVGIAMAKSTEGDAVATVMRRHEDVEVYENAAFWDIRAKDRLIVRFDEVADELGYEFDSYSIQHELSISYGRLVATDDALMVFSDPLEAMDHLTS